MYKKQNKTTLLLLAIIIAIVSCSFSKNNGTKEKQQKVKPFKTIKLHLQKDSVFLGYWLNIDEGFNYNDIIIKLYIKNDSIYWEDYRIVGDTMVIDDRILWKKNHPNSIFNDIVAPCLYTFTKKGNEYFRYKRNIEIDDDYCYAISAIDSSFCRFDLKTLKQESIDTKIAYPLQPVHIKQQFQRFCQKNDSTTIARWDRLSAMSAMRLYTKNGKYWLMFFSDYHFEEREVKLVPHKLGTAIVSVDDDIKDLRDFVNVSLENYYVFSADTTKLYKIQHEKIINTSTLLKIYSYGSKLDIELFGKGFKWK